MPAHSRRHGEGSIVEVGPGVYRAFKPAQSGRKRESRRFSDREQARLWLDGTPAPPVLTLKAYLSRWLALRSPTLRPRTRDTYRQFLGYVEPLYDVPLADLTADRCQGWINALLDAHTRESVKVTRGILSGALKAAVPKLIASNPLVGTRLPMPEERRARAWRQDEVSRLLASAEGSAHAVWLAFAIGTGLRLGELRALEWSDLDLVRLTVSVTKSMDNVTHAIGPTKTGRSRVVDLPDELAGPLRDRRARQKPSERYVFGHDGRAYAPQTYRSFLASLCDRVKVTPLAPHSTRHTFASLALAADVPIMDISHALGHANVATTLNIYAHYISHERRATARALGAILGPGLRSAPELHRVEATTR